MLCVGKERKHPEIFGVPAHKNKHPTLCNGCLVEFAVPTTTTTMKRPQSQLRSVCIVPSREGPTKITTPGDVDLSTRQLLRDTLHSGLEKTCPASTWSGSCHIASCPYPLLIDNKHQLELVNLNKALVKAIDDIIGRWWKDVSAKFPERMPLQPVEERLLRVSGCRSK